MITWFLDNQLKILLILGAVCTAIVFIFDFRGVRALLDFLLSIMLVFVGQKSYQDDTAENWLKFSYANTLMSVIGIIIIFWGWIIFLQGVLALAIASILLKTS